MDEPDDVAGKLSAALEGGAQFIDDGSFTLDAAQARKKLRERRLADPRRWVLFVIEAAWLLEARLVKFLVGARSVEIEIVGHTLDPADLERLYDPLVGDGEANAGDARRRRRAMARLAIAIEAAFASGAKSVELLAPLPDADDGARAARARIEPEGNPRLDEVPIALRGNHLQLDFGFGWSWGELEDRLADACRWSTVWIEVGALHVNAGLRSMYDADPTTRSDIHDVRDDHGDRIGYAWLGDDAKPAEVCVLTRGVFAERVRLQDARRGLVAIVDTDLERDIGEAKLRQSPELDAMLALTLGLTVVPGLGVGAFVLGATLHFATRKPAPKS